MLHEEGGSWVLRLPVGESGMPGLERDVLDVMAEAFELFCVKNQGYGTKNINRLGVHGIATRVQEKCDRVKTMLNVPASAASHTVESIKDSLLDISIYGVVALLKHEGDWPRDSTNGLVDEVEEFLDANLGMDERELAQAFVKRFLL